MGSVLSHAPEVKWETFTDRQTLKIFGGSLVAAFVLVKVIKKITGPKLPPQPSGIPFLGNIRVFTKRPTQVNVTFKELADEYGDVFMLTNFGEHMVLLNTVEAVKEAYHKNADFTSARPQAHIIDQFTYGGQGIVWNSKTWRESRRFALSALRDFGYGKKSIENKVLEEGEALIKEYIKHGGEVFDPRKLLMEATANIIFSLCFGSRYEYSDPKFRNMVGLLSENMRLSETFSVKLLLMEKIPILRCLSYPEYMQKQFANIVEMDDFMAEQISEHKLSYDSKNIRDFVDVFIQRESEENADGSVISDKSVFMIVRDLLHTGTETTSLAIQWAFLYLVTYPDVQKRIHQELDQVVGTGRLPSLADRPKLNYFHAFFLELLRVCNIAPAVLPHICDKDIIVCGYTIPKGANVMANLYTIHMSEKYWDDPQAFKPERFLDSEGRISLNKEGFLAFGTGPRQCLGEGLARTEFFLFMAMLLQKFTIKGEDDSTPPSLEGIVRMTHVPVNVEIRAVLR